MHEAVRIDDALWRHKFLRLVIGLGDVPRHQRLFRIYSIFYLITLMLFQVVMYMCLQDAHSILDINEILTPGVILTLLQLKRSQYLHHLHRSDTVWSILRDMETDTTDASGERQLIGRALRTGDWLVSAALASCQSVIVTRFIVSFATRELMFPSVLPFDWQHDFRLYAVYNCVQFVLTVMGSCGLSTLDTAGPMMYLLLDAFVEILSGRVQRLGGRHQQGAGAGVAEPAHLRHLIECIRMHQKCVRISELVNEIFGIHYLFQFGACTIGLCTIVFVLTQITSTQQLFDQAHLIICVLVLSLQVFVPCFFSNMLHVKSQLLLENLYSCHWIERSARFKTTLLICMQRAHRPMLFTTFLNVFEINLATFVAVCKTAYSILSCLT